MTLDAYADSLESAKLVLFPQLFWSAVALLNSNVDDEFLYGVTMLSKLFDRLNVAEEQTRTLLMSKVVQGGEALSGGTPSTRSGLTP